MSRSNSQRSAGWSMATGTPGCSFPSFWPTIGKDRVSYLDQTHSSHRNCCRRCLSGYPPAVQKTIWRAAGRPVGRPTTAWSAGHSAGRGDLCGDRPLCDATLWHQPDGAGTEIAGVPAADPGLSAVLATAILCLRADGAGGWCHRNGCAGANSAALRSSSPKIKMTPPPTSPIISMIRALAALLSGNRVNSRRAACPR